jgi:glycine betaine/choline ABC-type transport system substrate-binding protein
LAAPSTTEVGNWQRRNDIVWWSTANMSNADSYAITGRAAQRYPDQYITDVSEVVMQSDNDRRHPVVVWYCSDIFDG